MPAWSATEEPHRMNAIASSPESSSSSSLVEQQQKQQLQQNRRGRQIGSGATCYAAMLASLAFLSAASSSSVSAFQSWTPLPFLHGRVGRSTISKTQQWVATDPEILLSDPYLRQKLEESLAKKKKKQQQKQNKVTNNGNEDGSMYLQDDVFRSKKESLASLYYSSPDYDGFYQEEVMYQEEVVKSPITKKLKKKKTMKPKQQPRLKKTAAAAVSKAKAAKMDSSTTTTRTKTRVTSTRTSKTSPSSFTNGTTKKPRKVVVKKSKSTAPSSIAATAAVSLDDIDLDTTKTQQQQLRRKPQFKTSTKRKRRANGTTSLKTTTTTLLPNNTKTSVMKGAPSSSSQQSATTPKKPFSTKTPSSTTTASKKPSSKNKKATMPGFSTRHLTGRQKAFQDGIKLVEARTGKTYKENTKSRERRRKKNSETMYKTSASVPDSLVQFASEIHKEDRISPTEEVELGTKTQEAIRLQSLHDNLVEKLDREPTNEEWCAAAGKINFESLEQALEEGLEAKNKLVTSNLRMVQGVVNIYIRNGLGGQYNAGDMMQEGTVALIRAAEKFEPDRGFRFSTYAMYWIRAAVKRSQIFQSRVVNVPQRLYENHKRILRVEKELKQSLGGRDPTRKELGEAVNMSEQQIERCMTAMEQRIFSLDAEIQNKKQPNNGDDNKDTMYELIDSRSSDDGEYHKIQRLFMRQDLIETLYRHLSPLDVDLLLLRFGLMDERTLPHGFGGPLTIAEVSRLVGLKPDKVRRMINNSLNQLKFLIANEWGDFERDFESLE